MGKEVSLYAAINKQAEQEQKNGEHRKGKRGLRSPKETAKAQEREAFLAAWRSLKLPPLEAAERLGVDPALALAWAREWREQRGSGENLGQFLLRLLYDAKKAREWTEREGHSLSPHALMALSKLANMIPLLEEAWQEVSERGE